MTLIHEEHSRVLTGDNPLGVDVELDLPQVAPEGVALWNETFFYSTWDPELETGYFIHAGSEPADPTLRFAQVIVYLPGGKLVTSRSWSHPAPGPELTVGQLTMTTVDSTRRWRLQFDGAGELTTSAAAGGGVVDGGIAVPLSFDLEVIAAAPTWEIYAATGLPHLDWAGVHFEQNIYSRGTLVIDGEKRVLNGYGFRDHSTGPRDFARVGGDRFWGFVSPTSGRSCQGIKVWNRQGELELSTTAYHLDGSTEIINAADIELTGLETPTGQPHDLTFAFTRPSGERITAHGRILHTVTISIADPNHNVNGALLDSEDDPLILSESQVRFDWPDGDVFYGHLERVARRSTLDLGAR